MAEFRQRVIALSRAAWSLRRAAPRASTLPFALALFTDPDRTPAIERLVTSLPRNMPPMAVIFRHDALPPAQRYALANEVRQEVQARGHLFLMARGHLPGADGTHAFSRTEGLRTAPSHGFAEARRAVQQGADALFISPVLPTESHPGAPSLGPVRAARLAASVKVPSLALGGINERTARVLHGSHFQGFGAIGAFLERP
ncbi:MAG: thiamine phosphate synthase [Pseudomonadota bacterium]